MIKVRANELRGLAKRCESSDLADVLIKSADYIEGLEKEWELLKLEINQMEEFHDRCNSEEAIDAIHDIQGLMSKMETGEYYEGFTK